MIRAVGFDLGETLIEYEGVPLNWREEYPSALAAVASLWTDKPTEDAVKAGIAVLERFNSRLTPRVEEVKHTLVFGEILTAMDAPDPCAASSVEAAAEAFFAVFQRRARAFPEAQRTISTLLAAGIPVGVLSDVPYGMPRGLLLSDLDIADLSGLAETTLTSVDVGVRKPDPRGYVALAALLGCPPGEMLFVGNEEKDIRGAVAAGMQSALLWRAPEPAPSWGQQDLLVALDDVLTTMGIIEGHDEQM